MKRRAAWRTLVSEKETERERRNGVNVSERERERERDRDGERETGRERKGDTEKERQFVCIRFENGAREEETKMWVCTISNIPNRETLVFSRIPRIRAENPARTRGG